MGDVVHSMPAVAALREIHPEWEIRWAIEPKWSELLAARDFAGEAGRCAAMPLVDKWYRVPTKEWKGRALSRETAAEIRALWTELREQQFDLCVDMQWAIRSAVVGRMAGAKRFVGVEKPREGLAWWFYQERVKITTPHVAVQGCELIGAAIGEKLTPARVPFPVNAEDELWADGVVDGERFCLISPSAGWGAKEWPAERYGAVAAALGKIGVRTLVNATAQGDEAAGRVTAASEGFARAVPCSVGQLIALSRRAAVVIGGDTGPVHLAAALDRPVVGIYGPTDPVRNGPFGDGPMKVLRDASSVTDHAKVSKVESGLLRIGVDEVVAAAMEVLREK
jgi:heptosyltransferase-1